MDEDMCQNECWVMGMGGDEDKERSAKRKGRSTSGMRSSSTELSSWKHSI